MGLQTTKDKGKSIFQTTREKGRVICTGPRVRGQQTHLRTTRPESVWGTVLASEMPSAALDAERVLLLCVLNTFSAGETWVFRPCKNGFPDTEKMSLLGISGREWLAVKSPESWVSTHGPCCDS